ncbi:hypothetical protein PG994_000151 [Apiospora phragmitis]|uniref:Rhodopsin domain-containing protein n=1 Tax=Apiospora phragmitis TaxID=2905665 RepID=A0ABR1X5H1_9PEZI
MSSAPMTLITIWIVTGIAFIFTTGRLYVRGFVQRRLRSDDYLTIFSMINSIAACGLATKAVSRGLGRHLNSLSPEDQSAAAAWTFAAFFPGLLSFAVPKLAVISLLFMGVAVQLAQFGTMGFLIGDLAEKCEMFDPVQTQKPRGMCVPMQIQVRYFLFGGSISAFADFYLAAYPAIVLYHLQMPPADAWEEEIRTLGRSGLWYCLRRGHHRDRVVNPYTTSLDRQALRRKDHGPLASLHDEIHRRVQRSAKDRHCRSAPDTGQPSHNDDDDFTLTNLPEELSQVHRMDSGIDGMAYNHPCHGTAEGYHIRGDPRPGVIVENPAPKE